MLLTKETKLKLHPTNIEYLKSLGYEIPMRPASEAVRKAHHKDFVYDIGGTIAVKTEDLPPNSQAEVDVLCDYCGVEIIHTSYLLYTKAIKSCGKYACPKCLHLKIEEANINKYGIPCVLQSEHFREKGKQTLQKKYGVSYYSQTSDYRIKYDKTCKERYGNMYYNTFVNKAFNSFKNKTGYDYPTQSPDVREKILLSVRSKYGVDYISQDSGVKAKKSSSFYKHGSICTSSQQLYLHNLYGGEINYSLRFYNIDICFPEEKLCIEYSGGGHDLGVKMKEMTSEEFKRKEIIRYNCIKKEGYKLMEIISHFDYLPSDDVLLHILQHTRQYFSAYPNHSWIQFDIDASTVRNAEQKDGVFFNFGKLRRIKPSDVVNSEI